MPSIDLYFFSCVSFIFLLCLFVVNRSQWSSSTSDEAIRVANYWVTCKNSNFYHIVNCGRKSHFLCSNMTNSTSLDPHCLLISAPTHRRLSCQVFMPLSVYKVHFHPILAHFCPSVETETNRTNYLRLSLTPVCFL